MGKNNPEQVKENTFVMKIWLKLSFFVYLSTQSFNQIYMHSFKFSRQSLRQVHFKWYLLLSVRFMIVSEIIYQSLRGDVIC